MRSSIIQKDLDWLQSGWHWPCRFSGGSFPKAQATESGMITTATKTIARVGDPFSDITFPQLEGSGLSIAGLGGKLQRLFWGAGEVAASSFPGGSRSTRATRAVTLSSACVY